MWGTKKLQELRDLEGRNVSVALIDGTRLDDCQLVSTGRGNTTTLWLYSGADLFVPFKQVIDLWESAPAGHRAA